MEGFIGHHSYYQVVTLLPGAAENVEVPDMKGVPSPGNVSHHRTRLSVGTGPVFSGLAVNAGVELESLDARRQPGRIIAGSHRAADAREQDGSFGVWRRPRQRIMTDHIRDPIDVLDYGRPFVERYDRVSPEEVLDVIIREYADE